MPGVLGEPSIAPAAKRQNVKTGKGFRLPRQVVSLAVACRTAQASTEFPCPPWRSCPAAVVRG
eukprot:7535263-Pyramimonas_sp.AAC.1